MKAWLFDVDGVITDINTKEVKYPQILQKIVERLINNEPVGIITGRTLPKIINKIIAPIEKMASSNNVLDLLSAQGEFGGSSIEYKNGERLILSEERFFLSEELIQKGKGIIEKFGDVVFFDLKKTFFTAEMKDGGNIEIFKARQKEIAEELQKLVEKSGLNDSVEVHQDTIAVNVKNKKLNKHLATQKFLEWLAIKKIEPDTFYVFGDSASDLQIGEELNNQGKKIKFIYTGAEDLGSLPFEIIKTQAKFDQGTVEYLLSKVQ